MSKTLNELSSEVMKFRDERDWARYHHALDLAVAMNIECAEVLEHLRFKSREEAKEYLSNPENKKEFSHEIADIFIFMLALCNSEGIDLEKAFTEKLEINRKKYPIEKAYGIKDKYDKLR